MAIKPFKRQNHFLAVGENELGEPKRRERMGRE